MSHYHSLLTDQGFAASNLKRRCSNRISQALKHITGKGRTAPHTKHSQGSSQQETNTLIPKKPESASSITLPNYQGLMAGSRTSAGKRAGCCPPWSCQGLDRSPTTPLSHISQTLHFPSAAPFFTPYFTHKAPALLTHLWEHRGSEDRTAALSEQTRGQLLLLSLQVRVSPASPSLYRTIPWNQHLLSLIPELPQQQAWHVELTTHCSAPFHSKRDPGARELLWSSAEPQEM